MILETPRPLPHHSTECFIPAIGLLLPTCGREPYGCLRLARLEATASLTKSDLNGVANDSGSVTFEPSSTDISKVSCNLPASSSSALIVFVMSLTATFIFRPPAWMLYLRK